MVDSDTPSSTTTTTPKLENNTYEQEEHVCCAELASMIGGSLQPLLEKPHRLVFGETTPRPPMVGVVSVEPD